jgi:muramoyltetrapeptide carboxypeptidase
VGTAVTRPTRLIPGDVVGVVAPAGVVDERRLQAGVEAVRGLGFEVRLGAAVRSRAGYLAGDDAARLADLETMLDDPTVKAVFCARGGYGSQRLVPRLASDALARTPKILMGYSDVTALLAASLAAGVVGVHGPMVADDFARGLSDPARAHVERLLTDPDYRWRCPVPDALRPGVARGRLVGGCLTVLATTLGTPWALDTRGAVLFLEDVHERSYRLDRLLLQLRQAGKLDEVAGVVLGTFEACGSFDGVAPIDVLRDHFRDAPYPVGFGVTAGHLLAERDVPNWALPLGIEVELDLGHGELRALEGAVA